MPYFQFSENVAELNQIFRAVNGEAMADSRDVASYFEQDHKNVLRDFHIVRRDLRDFQNMPRNLRDYRNIPRNMSDLRDFCCILHRIRELQDSETGVFCQSEFKPVYEPGEIDDLGDAALSHVMMTESGFALLVMGFTGAKALKFKESYIYELELMQHGIKLGDRGVAEQAMAMLNNPKILKKLLSKYREANDAVKSEVDALELELAELTETNEVARRKPGP